MVEIIGIVVLGILGIQQIVIISKLEDIESLFIEEDFEEEEKK